MMDLYRRPHARGAPAPKDIVLVPLLGGPADTRKDIAVERDEYGKLPERILLPIVGTADLKNSLGIHVGTIKANLHYVYTLATFGDGSLAYVFARASFVAEG
jgi:hypothetical protein